MRADCWLSSHQGAWRTARPIALCVITWYTTPHHYRLAFARHAFHADRRHRGGQRPYYPAKGQPQAEPHHKGTAVLEVCKERTPQGMEMEHSNKAFTLPQSTLATGTAIGTNQFGKVIRKYEWNGTGEAMQLRLAEILSANFAHYFKPSLFGGQKQAQPQQGTMLTLFDLFGKARQRHSLSPTQADDPTRTKCPIG